MQDCSVFTQTIKIPKQPRRGSRVELAARLIASLALLLVASVSISVAQTKNDIIEVPFIVERGHPIIKADIDSKGTEEFVISTGAEHSYLTDGSIEKYKLKAGFTNDDPRRCNLADCYFGFVDLPNLRVGDFPTKSFKMRLLGPGSYERAPSVGRSVFGVLGADFFKGRTVQFDFARKVMRFLTKNTNNSSRAISFKMTYYDDGIILPIVDGFMFGDKRIKILLDTGLPQVIVLSPSAAKRIKVAVPEDNNVRRETFERVTIGSYEMRGVPSLIYGKGSGLDRDLQEFGAIAGIGLLQNFVVTFDFGKKEVHLLPL